MGGRAPACLVQRPMVWAVRVRCSGDFNFKVEWVEGCLDPVWNQNTPSLGHQYYTGVCRLGSQRSNFIRGPNIYTMWVTLLDYILSLRRRVFSLWTFLSCGCDKEHTDLCVLIIPQEQAWLRVLARPGMGNKEGLSLCPSLSVLGTFRRTLTGQRSTPFFALQFSQFPRLERRTLVQR